LLEKGAVPTRLFAIFSIIGCPAIGDTRRAMGDGQWATAVVPLDAARHSCTPDTGTLATTPENAYEGRSASRLALAASKLLETSLDR
jgi:hypothetical protein